MLPILPIIELSRRYCEPHRRYHTIEHVAHMLWRGRAHALTDEQVAAVWFHDAVYDPRRDDNEERSAALAVEQLTALGWPRHATDLVQRIVLDTRRHIATVDAARTVIDLDLYGLSADREVFERDGRHIRAEFAHVDDETFMQGRRTFFEELMARDRIYWTTWGARLEGLARANIRRALREL